MKISDKELKKLIVISSVCFLLLWKIYVLGPVQKKVSEYEIQTEKAQSDFVQLKNRHMELLEKKMEFILNKEKNKELEFYLLKDKQQILNIINDIFTEAKNNNIIILNSSAGKKILYYEYFSDNFLNMTIHSDYNDFLRFIDKISDYKYMIQMHDIDIRKSDNSNLLEIKISFTGFSQQ